MDKPLPKSSIRPILSSDITSKICKVLRLLLGPVSELVSRRPPATDWETRMGLLTAFEIASGMLMHPAFLSQLLPVLPDSP
ncbi:hypothetical protein GPECTOR_7g991 [Gonium pectorale]|uniref:Uncharacterized protein n=1 Tax=Gonium pectorale TaxID=33097 RepID=A0A150GUN2_GONPE|nr:hypothetical protein GPECTOR_7g991 [Gonium pectorale]|eukprot:KXZ53541.1 hypothetical protein GPECTOR_7g991 [Gonium pectorale]